MLTLYTNATPNGHRAAIMLEETGVPYRVSIVDLAAGEHKTPEFRAINATGRIPAIVDDDAPGGPLALAETLAIADLIEILHAIFIDRMPYAKYDDAVRFSRFIRCRAADDF